jgi:hypothetical protein
MIILIITITSINSRVNRFGCQEQAFYSVAVGKLRNKRQFQVPQGHPKISICLWRKLRQELPQAKIELLQDNTQYSSTLITSMETVVVLPELQGIHEDNVQVLVLEEDRHVNKQHKKKSNHRIPLCTFFNYLDSPAATAASSSRTVEANKAPATCTGSETERTATDNSGDDAGDDPVIVSHYHGDDVMIVIKDPVEVVVAEPPSPSSLPVESMDDDDDHQVHQPIAPMMIHDDSASVETVNTSNKSVDILYLRPDSGSFEKNIPAVERWKKPPSPITDKLMLDLDALYVTSRCESDDDDEEAAPISRPIREIVVKTRRRLPSLQSQWRTKHSKRYCLG